MDLLPKYTLLSPQVILTKQQQALGLLENCISHLKSILLASPRLIGGDVKLRV